MRKKFTVMLLAAVIALGCTACGNQTAATADTTVTEDSVEVAPATVAVATEETHAADTTVYNIAGSVEPPTLDVHISIAKAARVVGRYLYEGLVDFDENYNVVCQLAESYDVSSYNTEYTFHLRRGVKFHNGEEMKADDVVASLNRWAQNSSTAATVMNLEKDKFEKVDDYTVSITLSEPSLLFCQVMAGSKNLAAIMPASVIESAGDTGVTEYIGTGPLKLVEWKENSYIKFEKFVDYTGNGSASSGMVGNKAMNFDTVMYYIVTDATTRLAGVKTGEYDIADISLDNLSDVTEDKTLNANSNYDGELFLMMNNKSGACADENFRKAVSYAISLDDVMYSAYPNDAYFRISEGLMAQEMTNWFTTAGSEYLGTYDIEKAKEYLAQSGYNGETVHLMTSEAYPAFYNATLTIETYLKAAGINTQVDVYDWSTMVTYTKDDTMFDMYVVSWTPVGTPFELSYMSPTGTGWTDITTVNEGRAAMNACATIEDAASLWGEVQSAFYEKAAQIKLGDIYSCWATKSYVKGDKFTFGELIIPWDISKE